MSKLKPMIGEMHERADGTIVGPVEQNHSDRYPFRIGPHTYDPGGYYYAGVPEHHMNLVAVVTATEPAAHPAWVDAVDRAQVADLGETGSLRQMAEKMAYHWGEDHADEPAATAIKLLTPPADANDWNVEPGYEVLSGIFREAHNVAAHGKGKARHSNGERFEDQLLMAITSRHGIGFPLGQAEKKLDEAHGMVRRGEGKAAVAELLDVINYAAAAILHIRTL